MLGRGKRGSSGSGFQLPDPYLTGHVTVRDALLVMGRAKAGSVSVVDRKGRLVGVFVNHVFSSGEMRIQTRP